MTKTSNSQAQRREFLKKTGAAMAASAVPFAYVHADSLNSHPVDVMIIGSGFGGAVSALRLAQHGISCVMLERGRRWPVTPQQNTFSTMTTPDGRSTWLDFNTPVGNPTPVDKYIGVLQRFNGNGVSVLAGAGVGGGSLVYNGVTYLPHRSLFKKVFGASVDYDEMESIYYPRALSMIGASTIPRSLLATPQYAAAKEWLNLGLQAGLDAKLIPEALDWTAVAEEIYGRRVPSVTAGEFWYGNNSGAKLSLDKSYLKKAEELGKLEIVTQHDVSSIQQGPDGRYLVTARQIDTNGATLAERRFVVKKLFVSAGSIGTSRLLTKAKAKGWLPRLNEYTGQHWGTNGDFFSAITGLQSYVDPIQCGTAPVAIEHLDNPLDPISLVCFADYFSKGNKGQVTSIGMTTGPAKGSFKLDPSTDEVGLSWPATDVDVQQITRAATLTYQRLANAYGNGRQMKFTPVRCGVFTGRNGGAAGTTPVDAQTCSHPVGGMVIDLATDNIGMVKNNAGLYVVDGALVPGSAGCANPSFTIAALSERNIERIIRRDF